MVGAVPEARKAIYMTIAVPAPRYKSAFRLKMEADLAAVVCTHSCDCGEFAITGPTGEAREQLRAHRVAEHPERPAIAKRPKKPKAPRRELNREEVKILNDLADRQNGRKKTARQASRKEKVIRPPRVSFTNRIGADELHRLYVEEGMPMVAIGAIYSVSHATVRTALQDHGIPIRHGGPLPLINDQRRDAAWRVYEKGFTAMDISKLTHDTWGFDNLESCRRCLTHSFTQAGLPTRSPAESIWLKRRSKFTETQALDILKEAECDSSS
jgi:hypothetical protein